MPHFRRGAPVTEDARGIFAADMAANLLAAFLLILALLPYAEPPAGSAARETAMTVTSGRAFVEALHRRAVEGADGGRHVEIRRARDLARACGRPSETEPLNLVILDPQLLPTVARTGCPALARARLLIVPASLKGADGDWSPAVRRLLAVPDTPEAFRRDLLALLQGGVPADAAEAAHTSGMIAAIRRLADDLRRWGDFITAAAIIIFLRRRVSVTRERGSS
jgi:hypothetical protein